MYKRNCTFTRKEKKRLENTAEETMRAALNEDNL